MGMTGRGGAERTAYFVSVFIFGRGTKNFSILMWNKIRSLKVAKILYNNKREWKIFFICEIFGRSPFENQIVYT